MNADDRRRLRAGLVRLAEGDRSAFEPVYDLLWPLAVHFARRLVGPTDAEDVAQQAMMKLFAQASQYDDAKDGAAWALSLTAWECRTALTCRRRRREVDLSATDVDPGHDPRPELFERKVIEEARAVLETLSERDQATLRSAFSDEGQGATFRKRKQRALARLVNAWRTTHG